MHNLRKRKMADMPPGGDNPLDAAVNSRDRNVMDMVAEAVNFNQTLLAYQPIMQSRAPHGIAFYEGLIRVPDATGRIIPARDFIGQVENTELGRELDCNALELGLRALAKMPDLRLSINMSARSIGYKRWTRVMHRFLKKDPSICERLILEINEKSAMSMPELVIDFMAETQQHGICFTLDDFGSDSISVRHFRDFFFDAVKIDGQFIRGLRNNPDNRAVVEALIAVAKRFDMLTIAASVERVEDAEYLVSQGVDSLQGFLFGAPTVRPPWIPDGQAEAKRA